MKKKIRKTLILLVKLLVAAGLLVLVLRKVHWNDYAVAAGGREVSVYAARTDENGAAELQVRDDRTGRLRWAPAAEFLPMPDSDEIVYRGFRTTVAQADPYLLAGAFVCFLLPVFILAYRWWYLLKIQRIRIRLWEVVRLTFLGTFFNYVVPGTVSGDLVKAYYVSKHTDRKAAVLVSVFLDRALGLLEFVLLPAVVIVGMYCLGADRTDRLATPAIIVAAVLVAVVVGLAVLLSRRFRRLIGLRRIIPFLPLRRHISVVAKAADLYRRRPAALAKAVGITFFGQTIFIVGIMLSAFSLGLGVPWYSFFLYIPLIYIIASVPISPGGLGLAEAFYVTFFAAEGVSASEVMALALAARLIPMICSMPGLVVALTGTRLPRTDQIQAELAD